MLKNYLKIAWRNLTRNRVSSIINIGGLAIGLASVLLIALYVKDELSYDDFFKDADRIYRVNLNGKMGNEEFIAGHTPPPAGEALKSNFPQIEEYTRIYKPGDEVIHYQQNGQKSSLTERDLLSVDSNFLTFFNYPLVSGNAATCLTGTNSVVLTQKTARKYFGNTNAMGKTLVFDEYSKPFTVTGVLKDLPANSSLQFSMLQSNTGMPPVKYFNWSWVWLQMSTYVKLQNVAGNEAVAGLESKFPAMVNRLAVSAFERIGQPYEEFKKSGGRWDLELQPLNRVHLYSGNITTRFFQQGDIKNVYIFSVIALFIILLACVNFMNLSTAQSARRAKEVGIRKVLGSEKNQLVRQFITEAILYSLFAAVIAILIMVLVLPAFNQLANKNLALSALFNPVALMGIVLLVLLTGLLAGSYPAFYLTSFNPVTVLKGSAVHNGNSKFVTRNVLVVFQFVVSTVLIVCAIVVYKQLKYSQSKNLGFDKENMVVIANADRLGKSEESLRQELLNLPQVSNAAISTSVPAKKSFTDFYVPQINTNDVNAAEQKITLSSFIVDDAFIPTLNLKIIKGRAFSKSFSDSASVILNETAASQIGWKSALGKTIAYPGNGNQTFTVIGIVSDFNTESLHNEVTPFALFYTGSNTYNTMSSYITVRIKAGDYNKTINAIETKWKSFAPDTPFEYSFLDTDFDALYRADKIISRVIGLFTMLSLVVACMGLLGLVMHTAERRTKEIGIRKVLGATVQSVVMMLSKDFLKLILIASVIAFPIAWFAMNKWLQDFAYRTPISWWVFALAGTATVCIALLTVSFQSVRAAIANPVKSLRSE